MGVPKFYRWISERYPCLSEVVKEYQVPEFDNLYLDMNGIIHVCSHPNDDDPHFRITEEQIFKDIFHYIEVLFRIVRPRKVFFMAVDGVAPRAKMNQQRGRRFRSAKEAEENIKKALKKGESLPEEKRFDSNCITPGTKFMVRLQEQLEYMVKSKVTTDPAWQGIRIYLSGHETPGEGEHKITEFIRHERMQSDYDANTRHCLYGLDADLMMLGLCSHEPHFSLLREEVRFTGKKKHNARTPKAEETTFHLLHLSLMREYIDHEFESLKETLPFEYDLEAIIDDWVLMGFLVGNDFIPHLPHLHIAHDALPLLYKTYLKVLPTLDGYLNESGLVNLARFEKYLEVLAQFDLDKFEEHYADFRWLESKTGKRKNKNAQGNVSQSVTKPKAANGVTSLGLHEDVGTTESNSSHQKLEQKSIKVVKELSVQQGLMSADSESDSVGSQEDTSTFELEFRLYKDDYYREKLHFKQDTAGEVAKIAYEYVLAIQWICHYYYNGVQSWSWYYPYHYAPFLSDLRKLSKMNLRYDMAIPFMPYQQLLAVLPSASKECLPEPYWELMCSESSPIIDYYPLNFTCDLNGKQQEWEAVVLIPFINENRLLTAMEPCIKKLSKPERERNRHSGCQLYTFDANLDFFVKSSLAGTFPDLAHCKAKIDVISLHSWSTADISNFVKGILPGCRTSVFYPGFPTLHHLPHKSSLKKQGVKVFQMPSKNENMILSILSPGKALKQKDVGSQPYKKGDTVDDVAKNLLGTSVYVNWPHMEEAKVVAISDEKVKYEVTEHIHATGTKGSKHKMQRKTLSKDEQQSFWQDNDSVAESYLSRRGIDIGETDFLVYAQPLLGRKYVCGRQGQITLEKQWATKPRAYVLQAIVKDISVKDPTFQQFKGIDELFPQASAVFMLGQPYYGCQGKVLQVTQGMTSVEFQTPNEPDIEHVIRQRHSLSSAYYFGWELGSRLGISNYLVSRITGTIFVFYPNNQKWQVGLNLRFTRENSGIAGYTKLDNKDWKYSEAVELTLREYMKNFPQVLTYLQIALRKNMQDFDAAKMVGKEKEADVMAKLKELSTWLKSLDCYHGDKVNEYTEMLESKVVAACVEKVEECKKKKPLKPVQITLRPHVLYRPLAHQGTLIPDNTAQHRLLDRIVNVRDGYTVPLGMRGTIIGIHKQPGQDVLFDVIFDEQFLGGLELGGRCPKRRGYRMPECAMINICHGARLDMKDHKPTAVVRPQNKQYAKQAWQPQPQNQFPRDQHASSGRDNSPRHVRSSHDTRQQQREPQRSRSAQQPSRNSTTIMQRPNPESAQQGRQATTISKPNAAKPQSVNMFDTLWNSLKEQNKNSTSVSSAAKQKPNGNHRAVPCITAPKLENKKKTSQGKQIGGFATLSQAAKSLPQVKCTMQSDQNKGKDTDLASQASMTTNVKTVTVNKQSVRHQQTATKPTNTVTQAASSNQGPSDVNHLDKLFKSIKVSHPQPQTVAPRLAFTPTQLSPPRQFHGSSPSKSTPPRPTGPPPMNFHPNAPPFYPFYDKSPYQSFPPPFYPRTTFSHDGFQHFPRYPVQFGNRPFTHNPAMFMQQPQPRWSMSGGQGHRFGLPPFFTEANLNQEGTQELCEMLNSENEDASSSKWSTGEDEDDSIKQTAEEKTQQGEDDKIIGKFDDISIKDEASDGDSVKDEEDYMERSTSVEDENTGIIKKQTTVDELLLMCKQCSMLPPIYTYFTTGDEQVVSTVQLWNGVRFSSHPQITRDKAMGEAAGQALGYLKGELREKRPVSTSPPSTLPYYVPVHNLVPPQYYTHHAAYASPVSYGTAPHQAYFLPPVPYTMMPQAPVVTIPPEYQQAAIMHPQYRYGQYGPYVQHYPVVRVQVSPTHQSKATPAYHHIASPKPVIWSNYQKDPYMVLDKANTRRTEYKLLDEPPTSVTSQADESVLTKLELSKTPELRNVERDDITKAVTLKTTSQKKTNLAKPKLAISFTKEQAEK